LEAERALSVADKLLLDLIGDAGGWSSPSHRNHPAGGTSVLARELCDLYELFGKHKRHSWRWVGLEQNALSWGACTATALEYLSSWRTVPMRLFGMHSPFHALPVSWSHGQVVRGKSASSSGSLWRHRQVSLDIARAIALKGDVVGLWSLAPDFEKDVEAYGDRILELAEWLGEDHVAFGTDINGLGLFGTLSGYAASRRVVDYC
jgi:hypothetical protein